MCLVVSTLYIWAHNYYIVCAFVPLCVWIALCTCMSVLIDLCHACIHILSYIVHVFVLTLATACMLISCIKSFLLYIPVLVQAPYNHAIAYFPLSLSPFLWSMQGMYKHMYTNINIRVQTNWRKVYIHACNCKLTPMNTMQKNGINYIQCP